MKFSEVTDEIFQIWRQGIEIGSKFSSLGVFPKSFNGEDRTEWQDGWNAAGMRISENYCLYDEMINKNPQYWKTGLFLLLEDLAFLNKDKFLIICSDSFAYACADYEEAEMEEWEKVAILYDKYGYDGVLAWISHKRNENPLQKLQTDKFFKAKNELNENSNII